MEKKPIPQKKIVYVCLNERETGTCCAARGSVAIHAALKAAIKEKGLNKIIRVSRSGCMDCCNVGPNVLVFPDNLWFSDVTESDIPNLLETLLVGIE